MVSILSALHCRMFEFYWSGCCCPFLFCFVLPCDSFYVSPTGSSRHEPIFSGTYQVLFELSRIWHELRFCFMPVIISMIGLVFPFLIAKTMMSKDRRAVDVQGLWKLFNQYVSSTHFQKGHERWRRICGHVKSFGLVVSSLRLLNVDNWSYRYQYNSASLRSLPSRRDSP